MIKRLCLLLGTLLILTLLGSIIVRAEEDLAIDIIGFEIRYDPDRNADDLIIQLQVTDDGALIQSYRVQVSDQNGNPERESRVTNIESKTGRLDLKINFGSLPPDTYSVQVGAYYTPDATEEIIAVSSRDFVYNDSSDSNTVPQGVVYAVVFGGVVLSVAAGTFVFRRHRLAPKPAHTLRSSASTVPLDGDTVSVFLSYSRRDWDRFASPLVDRLRSEGVHVWVDQHTIDSGDDWMDEINEALQQSECLVLCVSPDALASKYVKMEYRYFISENKPILPVLCREADFPAELRGIQFVTYDRTDEIIEIIKQRDF